MSGPGTSRWGWVRGAPPWRLQAWRFGRRREFGCDRGTMSPATPTLLDAYTPCIKNATCRIPSVLHSLTVCLLNNRWPRWDWVREQWVTPSETPPPFTFLAKHKNLFTKTIISDFGEFVQSLLRATKDKLLILRFKTESVWDTFFYYYRHS